MWYAYPNKARYLNIKKGAEAPFLIFMFECLTYLLTINLNGKRCFVIMRRTVWVYV